jgi:undecaprenyl-diphosphatase
MMDILYNLDVKILFFINQTLSNQVFDFIMPLFNNVKDWIPFILFFWILLSYLDKKNRNKILILIPLVIIIGDLIGKNIKHLEFRDRPWFSFGDAINHLVGEGGKHYSFPSNHALNISSISYIFSSIYRNYRRYIWSYAFIIIFSRVYIGVHYPMDVLAGSSIGILVGIIFYKLYERVTRTRS